MITATPAPEQIPRAPSPLQVAQSVAWAFFGVQSYENRKRDFTYGNPWHFLIAGFVGTGVVVGIFCTAVQLALRYGGR